MVSRVPMAFLALCIVFPLHGAVSGQQPEGKGKDTGKQNGPDTALIDKLIGQLGSSKFAEREAAMKQLEAIGEPALELLRKAATCSADLETRRRVEQLADRVELTILEKLVQDGVQQHQNKDYKNAALLFDRAIKKGEERFIPKDGSAPKGEIPFLVDAHLHAARNLRKLLDYERAARHYAFAAYFVNLSRDRREQNQKERFGMIDQLISGWKAEVTKNADIDPMLKKLLAQNSFVVLHSRRYTGGAGDYLQSAYSFLHETAVEGRHRNDVQILFDNGKRDGNFYVRMVSNQLNRVADLGVVDFEKNPEPAKIGVADKIKWSDDECKAIVGHVYLENVKDEEGNDFYVLFKMIAVDKDSRYAAFVWRRLPGGKTVKRGN